MRLSRLHAYRDVVRLVDRPSLLACSGGVDSTALFVLMSAACDVGRVPRFTVAYVDHRTRSETREEREHVRRMVEGAGFEFAPLEVDLAPDTSSESKLRSARYHALAREAAARGIDTVVTAHTRDDQVETVLMRLLSGAGGLAAAGMHEIGSLPGRDLRLVRPLLGTTRRELQDLVDQLGIETIADPSNDDVRYRRNAVRQRLVPLIGELYPGFEPALLRSTALAAADAAEVDGLAAVEWATAVTPGDRGLLIDRERLCELPAAVAGRVVLQAARTLAGSDDTRELTHERIRAVLDALGGRSGATIELPYGIVARIERDVVRIETGDGSDSDRR